LFNKTVWKNQGAPQPGDRRESESTQAFFGYQKIPEQEKTVRVARHFDSVARRYDLMNTLLSFGIHYLWKRTAIRLMALMPGERVLDVCGGTGDLSILAERAVGPTGQVVLYDINRAMIAAGRAKQTNRQSRRRIQYVQGNAETLSLPDHCFDAAMVGFGIRNVSRMERGFAEMHRVLKPGGRLMCLEFSMPTAPFFRWLYDLYSLQIMPLLGEIFVANRQAYTHLPESIRTFPLPDRLSRILADIGFEQVRYHKLTNGIAVVHSGRKPRVPEKRFP
jgi:demethylmenaquinone methyltransferase/2-methoxy-6-polyprenyl-1,4-benzoquinol methylase